MPKGAVRPDANTLPRGVPVSEGRNTRILPATLSATKISPLGAARIRRGPSSPSASRLTLKPPGTTGFWLAVRPAMRRPFENEAPRSPGGRSVALMCRRSPGRSALQSVNAARPWSSLVPWASVRAGANRQIAISTEPPTAADTARRAISSVIIPSPAHRPTRLAAAALTRGKRVQFDQATWVALDVLARDRMIGFEALADGAFRDLFAQYHRPTDLEAALRHSVGTSSEGTDRPSKTRKRMRGGAQTDAGHAAFPAASTDRHCRLARTLGAVRLPYEFVAFQPTSSSTCYPAFRQILIRLAMLLLAQLPP